MHCKISNLFLFIRICFYKKTRRFLLKHDLSCSKNSKIKRFSTLPTRIVIAPDGIYDTYVDFNDDLELDTDIYKMFLEKQVVKILILFAVWNFKSCNTL